MVARQLLLANQYQSGGTFECRAAGAAQRGGWRGASSCAMRVRWSNNQLEKDSGDSYYGAEEELLL